MRSCKGKNRLYKADMTGGVKTLSRRIKAKIRTLSGGIPNKETWSGTRLKFMCIVRAEPGIAKAAKAPKFGVVGDGVEEFKKW